MGESWPLFVYFHSFHFPIQMTNIQFEQYKLKRGLIVCLGLESGATGCKAQMSPLSYGGTPSSNIVKI